jgi:hypothetical protein
MTTLKIILISAAIALASGGVALAGLTGGPV